MECNDDSDNVVTANIDEPPTMETKKKTTNESVSEFFASMRDGSGVPKMAKSSAR